MHGELAQIIALAAHGSVWLTDIGESPAPRLESTNSTFRYVRRVTFTLARRLHHGRAAAEDVATWLEEARGRGLERFWLSIPESGITTVDGLSIADRMLAAFAGGGQWSLVATSSESWGELWHAGWVVGDQDAPDQRIWDVAYRGKRVRRAAARRTDLPQSAERLLAALERAEGFARGQDLDAWADAFAEARRLGEAPDPQPPYHPDMLPAHGYAEPARRLVAIATRAWVFGGMGSWNDLHFEAPDERDEYDRVSAELYSALLGGLVAAVNSELRG